MSSYPQWQPQMLPDASQTDPSWPVGYPYECARSYQDAHCNITAGTRGKVLHQNADGNGIFVTMPYLVPQRSSWVPKHCLRIGASRKFGMIHIEAQLPPDLTLQGDGAALNSSTSQLHKALDGMSIAFRDNAASMSWLLTWFIQRLREGRLMQKHHTRPSTISRIL